MNDEQLSPQPEPVVEEKEPNPGGADAIVHDGEDEVLARDLDPESNPAVEDVLPKQVAELDEKSQSPDGKADDAEAGSEADPEAGQEAEDGSVEPPA